MRKYKTEKGGWEGQPFYIKANMPYEKTDYRQLYRWVVAYACVQVSAGQCSGTGESWPMHKYT